MSIRSNELRAPLSGPETARNQTLAAALAVLATRVMGDYGYGSYSPEVSVIIMALLATAGNLFRNLKENSVLGRWIG